MLILTNFDSFAITVSRLLHKFYFPIEFVLNYLQTQKSLELVSGHSFS